MPLSPSMAEVLASQRDDFNVRIAIIRSRAPAFDTSHFAAFLERQADPLICAVSERFPGATRLCVSAFFDMGAELVLHALAGPGARITIVNRIWTSVAPLFIPLIARDPINTLGALSNAAAQLSRTDGVDLDTWTALLMACAPKAESARDLKYGAMLAAWRAGASHLRSGSLEIAQTLPPHLACAAIGEDGDDWSALQQRFKQSRWWRPDENVVPGHTVGAFSGFGGPFETPPQVKACTDGFLVFSHQRFFFLIADAYGATLHAASQEEFNSAPEISVGAPARLSGTKLITNTYTCEIGLPSEGLVLSANTESIAVTSPFSHSIRVFPQIVTT
jgi:hypothetical protein